MIPNLITFIGNKISYGFAIIWACGKMICSLCIKFTYILSRFSRSTWSLSFLLIFFRSGQLLLKGCQFLDNKNQSFSNSFGGPWARLEVFLCELLTPALIDQPKCFSSTNKCFIDKNFYLNKTTTSPIVSLPCALLNQSVKHFTCIEANPPIECSESAIEMVLILFN
jgi:hypothetical protein